MGSYNLTCGLTNLPIVSGDRVAVFIIAQSLGYNPERPNLSPCYPDTYWEPVGLPFFAEYDDYGWVENVDDTPVSRAQIALMSRIILDRLKSDEERLGYDLVGAEVDFEKLGEWLHDDHVRIHGFRRHRSLAAMMVRADALSGLFERLTLEAYHLFGDFEQHGLADYRPMIRKRVEDIVVSYDPTADARQLAMGEDVDLRAAWVTRYRMEGDERRMVAGFELIRHEAQHWSGPDAFMSEEAIAAFTEASTIQGWLKEALYALRKHWSPQTGAGSQHSNVAPYEALIAAMRPAMHAIRTRWGEDEDEEADADEAENAFFGS